MVKLKTTPVQKNLQRLSNIHFLYLLAFGLSLIAFNAWQLLTPESYKGYRITVGIIAVVLAFVWLETKRQGKPDGYYKRLAWLLIAADITLAGFVVYAQRGMASRGVALFAIPIVVSTVFRSRLALIISSTVSALAYSASSLVYAAVFPREGYKIELYGTLIFYSVTFYLLAALLWVLSHSNKS